MQNVTFGYGTPEQMQTLKLGDDSQKPFEYEIAPNSTVWVDMDTLDIWKRDRQSGKWKIAAHGMKGWWANFAVLSVQTLRDEIKNVSTNLLDRDFQRHGRLP